MSGRRWMWGGRCASAAVLLVTGASAHAQSAPAAQAPAASAAQATSADAEFVKRLNAIYTGRDRAVPDERRSDLLLLPALAAMQPPPAEAGISTPLQAALLSPKLSPAAWSAAEKWASGEKQQAALDALRKVGEPGAKFAFLQGYGRDAADPLVRPAGLFTDLGDPPLLGSARFRVLPALDRLAIATHVEATRLAEGGKAREALTLLVRWTLFARQMADREFFAEKRWGVSAMQAGMERVLDIARTYPTALTDQDLADINTELNAKNLMFERILLPQGDRLAAEQVVARAFADRGAAKAEIFGPTMARITSVGRPLTQFGEAARWQEAVAGHAGTFDTGDQVKFVFDDWAKRWQLPPFDTVLDSPTDFARMDKKRFAMVAAMAGQVESMFAMRTRLRATLVGTEQALAVQAYRLRYEKYPPNVQATRPAYVKAIEPDPYSRSKQDFHFFVPIRDQPKRERELPRPHVIGVSAPGIAGDNAGETAAKEVERISRELVTFARSRLEGVGKTLTESMKNNFGGQLPKAAEDALKSLETFDKDYEAKIIELVSAVDPAIRDRVESDVRLGAGFDEAALERELTAALRPAQGGGKPATPTNPADLLTKVLDAFEKSVKSAPRSTFAATLDDSQFVLYSAGPDQKRGWARAVGAGAPDLLIWPALISLVRDELIKRNTGLTDVTGSWLEFEVGGKAPPRTEESRRGGSRSTPSSPGGGRPGGRPPL